MFVFREHRQRAPIGGNQFERLGRSADALEELRVEGREGLVVGETMLSKGNTADSAGRVANVRRAPSAPDSSRLWRDWLSPPAS